jgi:hypothetical protein
VRCSRRVGNWVHGRVFYWMPWKEKRRASVVVV